MEHGSYLGIFVFLVLTGCGMPLPEEIAIVLAGVLSAHGEMMVWPAYFVCLAGALVGDAIMYFIGYRWGHNLFRVHPQLAKLVRADREASLEQSIERHGLKVLVLARFLVGVRGPAYVAAGALRIPFRKFLMYDFIAATLVVSLFFGGSYAFGEEVTDWIRSAEWTLTVAIVGLVAVIALGWLIRRYAVMLWNRTSSDSGPRPPSVSARKDD